MNNVVKTDAGPEYITCDGYKTATITESKQKKAALP